MNRREQFLYSQLVRDEEYLATEDMENDRDFYTWVAGLVMRFDSLITRRSDQMDYAYEKSLLNLLNWQRKRFAKIQKKYMNCCGELNRKHRRKLQQQNAPLFGCLDLVKHIASFGTPIDVYKFGRALCLRGQSLHEVFNTGIQTQIAPLKLQISPSLRPTPVLEGQAFKSMGFFIDMWDSPPDFPEDSFFFLTDVERFWVKLSFGGQEWYDWYLRRYERKNVFLRRLWDYRDTNPITLISKNF